MNRKNAVACEVCRNRLKTSNSKPERLIVKKFCKVCRTHTIHKEEK